MKLSDVDDGSYIRFETNSGGSANIYASNNETENDEYHIQLSAAQIAMLCGYLYSSVEYLQV